MTYTAFTGQWVWAIFLLLALIGCIIWIIKLHTHQVKKVIFLLDALENNDNAIRFPEQAGNQDNRTINQLLNRVAQILQEARAETVRQEKYYELILSFINTGILVLNNKGTVIQKNNELLRLLGLAVFTHVRQLNKVDSLLMERLENAQSGDKFHVQFSNERGNINLSVRVSDITIRDEHLRIFALNDINSELDEKELDSWIRLIRVLTHEIMNSVTPITSLSDTLLSITENADGEIRRGLQTISSTGKGLLSFVDSYRKFTRIPTPEPTLFYVKPFVERMVELTKHQNPCDHITFHINITPNDLILYADESLISQVVINLLKNAVQAIGQQTDSYISISAYCNEAEEIFIEISNNGPQIPTDVAEEIFVPFFTTKSDGNGIGLSLSRQIMRQSGGSITLKPVHQSPETTFILQFM
nr:ATP-binding protein [Bacteroides sp. 51]